MIQVFRTQLAALLRRPSRILLTGLALSVASFVILGTLLARDVTEHMVTSTFSGTPEAVDLVVRSDDGLRGAALARAQAVPGVAEAVGRFTLVYDVGGHQPILLAADPGAGPLSTVKVVKGRYPRSAREIALTERTLDQLGLAVGDPLPAQVTLPEEEPTGTPGDGSTGGGKSDGAGGKSDDAGGKSDGGTGDNGGGKAGNPGPAAERTVDLTLTVTGAVKAPQDLGFNIGYTTSALGLGLPGLESLERIEVRLSPGASPDGVRTALAAAVRPAGGAAPTFETGASIRQRELDDNKRTVDEIFAVVGMFVAIAVLAAVLVATSTFRIVFAQRMRQLALLRAVGADRGALARALVLEGMCVGAVSGAVGAAAAVGVGKALPGILRPFDVFVPSPAVPVGPALAIVAGATVLAVLAVLAPAFSVARVAPLEALRSSATSSAKTAIGAGRTIVGTLLAGGALLPLGYVVTSIPSPGQDASGAEAALLMLVLSGALAYFALVALGPVLLRPVLAVVGWPVRRLSTVGRLAAGGVGAAPRRGAAISVVVALGVTLLAGVLVGGDSLRHMDEQRLAATAPADFNVYLTEADSQSEEATGTGDGSTGTRDGTRPARLPKGILDRVGANPTLAHPVPYRKVWTDPAGCPFGTNATDLDIRSLSTWSRLGTFAGSLDDLGPGKAVVAADLADTCHLAVGGTVDVRRDGRGRKLTVVAVMQETPLMAGIITGAADLDRLGAPSGPSGVLVDAAVSTDRGYRDARSVLAGIVGSARQVGIDPLYQERVSMAEQYAMLLAIPIGLVSLTVLVALVGVGTTTALSVVERVREAGMLRAVGMSRAGLRTMLTTEAGLYGAVGSALGLLLAVPYSWLAVRSLGADVPISFPIGQLALLVAVLTALTALAGLAPAGKAARVAPVAALAADDA